MTLVAGLAPDGRTWEALLHLETAAEMGIGRPKDEDDDLAGFGSPGHTDAVSRNRRELEAGAAASAEGALAWAAAAQVVATADRGVIEALLRSHEVFIEDLFASVLDAPGFPPAVEPASGFEE